MAEALIRLSPPDIFGLFLTVRQMAQLDEAVPNDEALFALLEHCRVNIMKL